MNRRTKRLLPLLLGGLSLLPACSEVPITGRKQLHLVPDSYMNSMSFQSYSEFLSQNKLSNNADQTAMVKRCGARIQAAVEKYSQEHEISLKGYQWEFNLIEDDTVNAWCMPGGKVVVYTGLLPVAQDETGLAVVMGHEIAHAIAKHGSERMSQGLMVELGGLAIAQATKNYPEQTRDLFMRSYGATSQYGVLLPYSRTHETEADHLGLIFMAMAGYDPHAAVAFWQRMAAQKEGQAPPEFLSTHPADSTRIRNIQEKFLPEALQYYQKP
ncbi:MAG: M48 family metallopeptidase [Sedimentisphaerales bacterium]|nr:M48 family metallopeptidase [Sedimentisphaerales bacterium]